MLGSFCNLFCWIVWLVCIIDGCLNLILSSGFILVWWIFIWCCLIWIVWRKLMICRVISMVISCCGNLCCVCVRVVLLVRFIVLVVMSLLFCGIWMLLSRILFRFCGGCFRICGLLDSLVLVLVMGVFVIIEMLLLLVICCVLVMFGCIVWKWGGVGKKLILYGLRKIIEWLVVFGRINIKSVVVI